jgi:ATP-dependent DNA helicase RecQ
VPVQKLLSAIYRTEQRFGAGHVIDVLRGADSEKVKQWGHERLSTYGVGADRSDAEWRAILRQAIALGLVAVDYDAYNSLKLTESARPVLRGEQTVQMRRYQKPERQKRAKGRSTAKDYAEAGLSTAEAALFEKLRWWRMEAARRHNVAAFVIFHDSTMREIAKVRPTNLAELRGVSGVGEKKLESYGSEIISLIESLA